FFFFQAEDGIRARTVTGVQTCALPICGERAPVPRRRRRDSGLRDRAGGGGRERARRTAARRYHRRRNAHVVLHGAGLRRSRGARDRKSVGQGEGVGWREGGRGGRVDER